MHKGVVLRLENAVNSDVVFGGAKMDDAAFFWAGAVGRDTVADVFDGFWEGCLNRSPNERKSLLDGFWELSNIFINKGVLSITHAFIIRLFPNCPVAEAGTWRFGETIKFSPMFLESPGLSEQSEFRRHQRIWEKIL